MNVVRRTDLATRAIIEVAIPEFLRIHTPSTLTPDIPRMHIHSGHASLREEEAGTPHDGFYEQLGPVELRRPERHDLGANGGRERHGDVALGVS